MKVNALININAPIQKVFATFNQIEMASEIIEDINNIEFISKKTSGEGTRWKETRVMYGKEATEEMEVTKVIENESITIEATTSGTHYETVYNFHRIDGDATQVSIQFTGTPTNFGARLFSPLMFLFKGQIRKGLEKDLGAYKEVLEQK